MSQPLLSVNDLKVEFDTYGGTVQAVRGVSFDVSAGETLAIVGESGCGKSVTVQSIMGLIPMPPGRITSGQAMLRGQDIIGRKTIDGNDIRGRSDRHDFPGSDDVAEPDHEHRQPDRRDPAGASGLFEKTGLRPGHRTAGAEQDPGGPKSAPGNIRSSFPAACCNAP